MGTDAAASPRSLSYDAWMTIAEEEYRRIDRLLADLDEAAWTAPTDCTEWDVRAMVAHLAGGEEAAASVRETLRQAWAGRSLSGLLVDRMNAVQVRERAGLDNEERRADLTEAASRGLARRRSLPRPVRAIRVPFGPPLGTKPVGYLMGCIYTRDAWLHRVDICRATGRPVQVDAGHDGRVVADVVAEWAGLHGRPYRLTLTGPAGGTWGAGVDGEEHTLDAVEFCRIASGRSQGEGLLTTAVPF